MDYNAYMHKHADITIHATTPRGATLPDELSIACSVGFGGVLTAFAPGTLYKHQPPNPAPWYRSLTHLRIDPILCLILHRDNLAHSLPLTRLRRHAAHGVQPVNLLDGAARALCLGLKTQPLDICRGLWGVAIFGLFGLCVAEADDVEVGRAVVDEEVRADGLCGFLDCAERACRCAGVVGHGARGVEELRDGADGGRGRGQVRAARVVLRAFAQGDEDELQVRGWGRKGAGWLRQAGEITC
jgi:hypothetical protein